MHAAATASPACQRPIRRAIDPVCDQRHGDECRAEEQCFGHRRALQVKDVGVHQEQCRGCRAGRDRASRWMMNEASARASRHRYHRYRDRRRAGSVARVHAQGPCSGDAGRKPDRRQSAAIQASGCRGYGAPRRDARARRSGSPSQAPSVLFWQRCQQKRGRRDHQGRPAHHVFADVRLKPDTPKPESATAVVVSGFSRTAVVVSGFSRTRRTVVAESCFVVARALLVYTLGQWRVS